MLIRVLIFMQLFFVLFFCFNFFFFFWELRQFFFNHFLNNSVFGQLDKPIWDQPTIHKKGSFKTRTQLIVRRGQRKKKLHFATQNLSITHVKKTHQPVSPNNKGQFQEFCTFLVARVVKVFNSVDANVYIMFIYSLCYGSNHFVKAFQRFTRGTPPSKFPKAHFTTGTLFFGWVGIHCFTRIQLLLKIVGPNVF